MAAFASQQPIDGLADTSYYQEELDRIRQRGNSVAQNTNNGLPAADDLTTGWLDFYNKQKSPIWDGKGNQIGFNHGYGVEERWDPQQPGDDKWISDEEWEQIRNEPSPPPDQRWPGLEPPDAEGPGYNDEIVRPLPIVEPPDGYNDEIRPLPIQPIQPPSGTTPTPGYGGRIGADPDSMFTMDFQDQDGDGTDDRHQRGPGQPYITWEDSTPEERGKYGRTPGGRDSRIGTPPGGWEEEIMPPGWGGSGTPPRRGESAEDYTRRMQEIQDNWDNRRREEQEGRRPPRRRGKDTWGPGEDIPMPVRPGLPRPPEPRPRPKPPGPRPPEPRPPIPSPEPRPPIPGPEPRPPIPGPEPRPPRPEPRPRPKPPGPRPPRPEIGPIRPDDEWGDIVPFPMPPGWEGCPTPDQQILLADKSLIFAGELQVGDKVHTMHETTFESGDYEVTHVSFHEQPVYLVKFSDDHEIRCSASHKLYSEDKEAWVAIKELGSGERVSLYDGEVAFISAEYTGDEKVVKITVEDAHTYICEGLFSHNKTLHPSAHPDHPDYGKDPSEWENPPKPPLPHGDPPRPKRPKDEVAIAEMYQDYLGRDADQEGFDYWVNQVRSGNQSLDQVAANIKASPESEDYRAKTPKRPTPISSGVGDEDYRAVSIRYAEGHEPSDEQHRINQKKFWEEIQGPTRRFGEKRNEERQKLAEKTPAVPDERKEEAKERSRQWQQDRGSIGREERAPKPNIGRDPERRPEPSRPEPSRPEPSRPEPKRDWLEAAYQDNLGRAADKGGRDYWAKEVESGRQTKEQVVENIRRSDEYKNRNR